MTGRQKAAAFLISLGPEQASEMLKRLGERDVELLTAEMANLQRIQPETLEVLHDEFAERWAQSELVAVGGMDFAREVLEKSVGRGKADEILGSLTAAQELRP